MRERLVRPNGREIQRTWAQKMTTHAVEKEAWEATVEARVQEKERAEWTRSLGWKMKLLEVLEQKETNLAIPRPRLAASLSFRSLRFKPASKTAQDAPTVHPVHTPHPTSSSSSVAWELQDRREALLRRAYELGFGTSDLRAFADEASRIVRVAREGKGRMRLEEIAREMERRDECDGRREPASDRLAPNTSACASAATTLVSENIPCVSIKPKLLDVPAVKVFAPDMQEGGRG